MDSRSDNAIESRKKYADAFNSTMTKVWRDRIRRKRATRAYDTGALFASTVMDRHVIASKDYTTLSYSWSYLEYGVYVERGTGRGVFRGNPGDIGRDNKRRRRRWMNPRLYSSMCNLRDFMAESVGSEFVQIVNRIAIGPGNPFDTRPTNVTSIPGVNLPN